MSGAEWGITADEGRAIIAQAAGDVLVRDTNTAKRSVHPARLLEVTNSRGRIHVRGTSGEWFALNLFKPAAGKARDIVAAMRAKKSQHPPIVPQRDRVTESTEITETTMPPEHAPRPQLKPVTVAATPIVPKAFEPGSFTLAASRIESAIREVDARRADLAAADRDLDAAKDLVRTAADALAAAEDAAKKLATDFNALVARATS